MTQSMGKSPSPSSSLASSKANFIEIIEFSVSATARQTASIKFSPKVLKLENSANFAALRHATRSPYSEYGPLEFAWLQHDKLHPNYRVFMSVLL